MGSRCPLTEMQGIMRFLYIKPLIAAVMGLNGEFA